MKTKKTLISVLSIVVIALILACICVMATGCELRETKPESTTATTALKQYAEKYIIFMPDGTKIEGRPTYTYTSSIGVITIVIDGKTYRTHYSNVFMISE